MLLLLLGKCREVNDKVERNFNGADGVKRGKSFRVNKETRVFVKAIDAKEYRD